jgi:hypothetical protein
MKKNWRAVARRAHETGLTSINKACGLLGHSKQAYHKGCRNEHRRRQREADEQASVLEKVGAIRRDMPRLGTRKLHYLCLVPKKADGRKDDENKVTLTS